MDDILRNPKTVKALADEIIKVCDGYWAREIQEGNAREYVVYWSKHEGKKLFKGPDLNSTIIKIIGKRRVELINKWLEDTQISF